MISTKNFCAGLVFALAAPYAVQVQAQGQEVKATSAIRDVTVYLNGAMVKRTAQVSLRPGTNTIIFEGLTPNIDPNSLSLEAGARATVLSVEFQNNYTKQQERTPLLRRLYSSLDSATQRLEIAHNERQVLQDELEMLKANHKVTMPGGSSYMEELEEAADFVRARNLDVRNKLSTVIRKEAEIQTTVNGIQTQINSHNTRLVSPTGEVKVVLNTTENVRTDFLLSYYVYNAGWQPVYNLRADEGQNKVKMDYDARVIQLTGEDWRQVKLTLSTGNPSLGGIKPELQTVYLPMRMAQVDREMVRPSAGVTSPDFKVKGGRASDNQYKVDDVESRLAYNKAELSEAQLNNNYEIVLKSDIPSDAVGKYVRIDQYEVPAVFNYFAVPKLDKDVFLLANLTEWDNFSLLPGSANVFLDGGFVGKTYLNPNVTDDTLKVAFGRDRRITTKRTMLKEFSKKQFLSSNVKKSYRYSISLRNTKSTPVELTVEDQIPVSTQKDISVDLDLSDNAVHDPATGKLTWKIKLNPNEDRTLTFEFTVKAPRGTVIE